ncbi:putative neutral sphingomyelinase [Mytilus edulis]|uniref:putative neutral sphingomyelinase n=1 Tax=Mytilus edulis TaxID=6550 RepID=UPI0039F0616E
MLLKVLTLNCWGVPVAVACKLRNERMNAIGDELSKGEYDIILCQEIWDKADYELLKTKISQSLKYSHYFYSGAIGSGLCLFSKLPILESFYHNFTLNGYAHKIHHGDWFGGKGLGMCRLMYNDIRINLYCTHLHAEYDMDDDEYAAHRVSQAFEMSQFIKLTSSPDNCDLVIVGGDFNVKPESLGFQIIQNNGQLLDSWITKKSTKSPGNGNTCDLPSNPFTGKKALKFDPEGKRIDYILYRCNKGTSVTVEECNVTMGTIPDRNYPYTDHEGVAAIFNVEKTESSNGTEAIRANTIEGNVNTCLTAIEKGLKKASSDCTFYTILAVMSVFLLYIISSLEVPYGLGLVRGFVLVILTLTFGYAIWSRLILNKMEKNGLINSQKDMENYLLLLQTEMKTS